MGHGECVSREFVKEKIEELKKGVDESFHRLKFATAALSSFERMKLDNAIRVIKHWRGKALSFEKELESKEIPDSEW